MQGRSLYEYAAIRIVPRVEREEFINAGVILYCKEKDFLKMRYLIDSQKLEAFRCEVGIEELEDHLKAIEKICNGDKDGGPVAQWGMAERFRWLTAERSSSIQTSRPHNGFAADPEKTLKRLFEELVL